MFASPLASHLFVIPQWHFVVRKSRKVINHHYTSYTMIMSNATKVLLVLLEVFIKR